MKIISWVNDDREQDFLNADVFYDFHKPIQILEGGGWSSELALVEQEGQFVLTFKRWPHSEQAFSTGFDVSEEKISKN